VVLRRRRLLVELEGDTCVVDWGRHPDRNLGVERMEEGERSLPLLEGVGSHCNRQSWEAVGMLGALVLADWGGC